MCQQARRETTVRLASCLFRLTPSAQLAPCPYIPTPPASTTLHAYLPHSSGAKLERDREGCRQLSCSGTMASRCSFLPLARLLLLVVLLGAALHGEVAVAARPLRGIAEPPASPGAVAAGPGDAAQDGAGGRPDRSEAGGEVILAGFAAALIIVIFCYIRVTRESSSSDNVGEGEKKESLGGF